MQFSITTLVHGAPTDIFERFDQQLFTALAPPFPRIDVQRFDGCLAGHTVHVELDFLLFRQSWISIITEHHKAEHEIIFEDTGTTLPFFLSAWRHRHIIRYVSDSTSHIIDDIMFESYHPVISFFMAPLIIMQFLYRKPIYKRYFRQYS
jgi:ligand-binding SRPBCC domain-containing protein